MSTAVPEKLITAEQFAAMPNDGMERDLVRGKLCRQRTMTKRNRFHAQTEAAIAYFLNDWLRRQSEPRGAVMSGEVGTILRRDPDTMVGIDIAFFDSKVMSMQSADTTMIEGSPVLAVEILSPSDKQEDINSKIGDYLNSEVPWIWIVDPHFKTVTVHRPSEAPQLFSGDQVLSAEPSMPGFSLRVSDIFK